VWRFFVFFGFTNLELVKKLSKFKYEQNNCCKDFKFVAIFFPRKTIEWGQTWIAWWPKVYNNNEIKLQFDKMKKNVLKMEL
jgi:hypothetical protein